MIERLKVLSLIWLAVFLQSSVAGLAAAWGMAPDLLAILIARQGLHQGAIAGMQAGGLSGFLADCYHPSTMGLYTLSGILCGYVTGIVRERIYREQLFSQLALVTALTLARQLFEFLFRNQAPLADLPFLLVRYGLGTALYTALIGALVLPGLNRWLRRPLPRPDLIG